VATADEMLVTDHLNSSIE